MSSWKMCVGVWVGKHLWCLLSGTAVHITGSIHTKEQFIALRACLLRAHLNSQRLQFAISIKHYFWTKNNLTKFYAFTCCGLKVSKSVSFWGTVGLIWKWSAYNSSVKIVEFQTWLYQVFRFLFYKRMPISAYLIR